MVIATSSASLVTAIQILWIWRVRILQGLPEHSPEFAVSYPDFVPIDPERSVSVAGVPACTVYAIHY